MAERSGNDGWAPAVVHVSDPAATARRSAWSSGAIFLGKRFRGCGPVPSGCAGRSLGMYLRTIGRRNKDGSEVRYVQLAHNEWDPVRKMSVARVIHSFGREDRLDRAALARLVRSLCRLMPGRCRRATVSRCVQLMTSASRKRAFGTRMLTRSSVRISRCGSRGPLSDPAHPKPFLPLFQIENDVDPALFERKKSVDSLFDRFCRCSFVGRLAHLFLNSARCECDRRLLLLRRTPCRRNARSEVAVGGFRSDHDR